MNIISSRPIINQISPSRGTLGVREMPDKRDSGKCHIGCSNVAEVRINLNGIFCSLCSPHRREFERMLANPLPAPGDQP